LDKLRSNLNHYVEKRLQAKYNFTLTGERKLDIFGQVDEPMSQRLVSYIEEVSDEFLDKIEGTDAERFKDQLTERFESELSGYSLHPASGHEVADSEALFEWYETTIERIKEAAQKSAEKRSKGILNNAEKKVSELEEIVNDELSDWIDALQSDCERLLEEKQNLEQQVDDLRNDIVAPKEALEKKLVNAEQDIEEIEEFKKWSEDIWTKEAS
jgi:predicted RNase H-like nuclease (RuvC/YqgF family)